MTTHHVLDQTITMPVAVRDASAATVIYDVDLAAARRLAPPGFEVIEAQPGRAQFVLALIDYRDNDLGTYHEIGTILFVRPATGGPDGYLHHSSPRRPALHLRGRQASCSRRAAPG
jgi:hypothetical protein